MAGIEAGKCRSAGVSLWREAITNYSMRLAELCVGPEARNQRAPGMPTTSRVGNAAAERLAWRNFSRKKRGIWHAAKSKESASAYYDVRRGIDYPSSDRPCAAISGLILCRKALQLHGKFGIGSWRWCEFEAGGGDGKHQYGKSPRYARPSLSSSA